MQLREIARDAMRTAPVFIVGAPRSGSSILYRILQKHSSFAPKAPNLAETDIFAYLNRAGNFRLGVPRPLWQFMLKDEAQYGRFLETIRPSLPRVHRTKRVAGLVRDLSGGRVELPWRWTPFPDIMRAYFHFAQQARGCTRLVEKTPHHIHRIRQLQTAFPRCQMLYIHRHPVDVYSSYRRRYALDRGRHNKTAGPAWANLTVDEFATLYRRQSEQAMQVAARSPERLLLVSYEAFTAESERTFAGICAFLSEPYEPEALVEDPDPRPQQRTVSPHLFGALTTKTKQWHDWVTTDQARAVEDALAETMGHWGYARYTDGAAP